MSDSPSGGAAKGRSDLRLRIVSAIVLGAVVLALTLVGGVAFRFFAAALSLLIFYEWIEMRSAEGRRSSLLAWCALIAAMAVMLAGASAILAFGATTAAFFAVLIAGVVWRNEFWSAFGILYAGVPAVALAFIRGGDIAGFYGILFLFAVVWATDVAAFFSGRAIGGPRLAPSISPGKTWSGAIGGAFAAVIAGVAVAMTVGPALSVAGIAAFALLLSILSQLGDLFESALKRHCGVKDSGTLIPGHGGIMDRVDGLIPAAIVFFLAGAVLSGIENPAFGFFFG